MSPDETEYRLDLKHAHDNYYANEWLAPIDWRNLKFA